MQQLREVQLAAADLGDHRHVCALFEGPEEAERVLPPFTADGIAAGERGVHMVDPAVRADHLELLTDAGVDVPLAISSGQLEIQTWDSSYLRDGRFDAAEMTAVIVQLLAEGHDRGYPMTRIIGYMGWAANDPPGVDELIGYEASVDELLRDGPDVVVCAYDLQLHSARTIADLLGVHSIALVGGVLRPFKTVESTASPRERILAAASRLFNETGVRATGVDALIRAAGVAKATFYRHFPSKDALVVAWLNDPRSRWLDRVRKQADRAGPAPDRIVLGFFDAAAEWLESEAYRGCPYLNTAAEITDPDHPALGVIRAYLDEVGDYLLGLVTKAGYRDPAMLAAELHNLMAGGIMLTMARRSGAPARAARVAAEHLLSVAERA